MKLNLHLASTKGFWVVGGGNWPLSHPKHAFFPLKRASPVVLESCSNSTVITFAQIAQRHALYSSEPNPFSVARHCLHARCHLNLSPIECDTSQQPGIFAKSPISSPRSLASISLPSLPSYLAFAPSEPDPMGCTNPLPSPGHAISLSLGLSLLRQARSLSDVVHALLQTPD